MFHNFNPRMHSLASANRTQPIAVWGKQYRHLLLPILQFFFNFLFLKNWNEDNTVILAVAWKSHKFSKNDAIGAGKS